jgi:hypothetical protein
MRDFRFRLRFGDLLDELRPNQRPALPGKDPAKDHVQEDDPVHKLRIAPVEDNLMAFFFVKMTQCISCVSRPSKTT